MLREDFIKAIDNDPTMLANKVYGGKFIGYKLNGIYKTVVIKEANKISMGVTHPVGYILGIHTGLAITEDIEIDTSEVA